MNNNGSDDGAGAALIAKATAAPAVEFVNHMLKDALTSSVRVIEMAVHAHQASIRFERDGTAIPRPAVEGDLAVGVVARLKILANVDPSRSGDGSFQLKVKGKSHSFELKAAPAPDGEILTLRISLVP